MLVMREVQRACGLKKKRFQVTHIPAALRTGMPGRRHRQTRPPGVIFSAPRFSLFSRNGSMLPSPPAASSCLEPTSRSGLSLTHCGCLFPGYRCEIDAPGRLLRHRTGTVIEPVRLYRSPTRSGLPRTGRDLHDKPVARLRSCVSSGCRISTPLGGLLNPLMDRSVQPVYRRKAHLCDLPDFPSLPVSLSLLTIGLWITVPGSLHLTRFDCSVNLLEPKPSCYECRITSNKIWARA